MISTKHFPPTFLFFEIVFGRAISDQIHVFFPIRLLTICISYNSASPSISVQICVQSLQGKSYALATFTIMMNTCLMPSFFVLLTKRHTFINSYTHQLLGHLSHYDSFSFCRLNLPGSYWLITLYKFQVQLYNLTSVDSIVCSPLAV